MVETDLDDYNNQGVYFAILANGTGTNDNMSLNMVSGRSKIKCGTSTFSTGTALKAQLSIGTDAPQSGTDIGSVDVINDVYNAGFTWNTAANTFIAVTGGMDIENHTFQSSFSVALNRLDIFGRPSGQFGYGHVRSVKIFNQEPSMVQLGAAMNFKNSVMIGTNGQSSVGSYWNGQGAQGVDPGVGLNTGEKSTVAALKQYYPTKRCYLQHGAMNGTTQQVSGPYLSWYDVASSTFQPLTTRVINMINAYVAGGGTYVGWWINGHESDINATSANLTKAMDAVMGYIWSQPAYTGGPNIGTLPTIYQPIARRQDTSSNGFGYQRVRHWQEYIWVPANSNVTRGTERITQPMESLGVHVTDLGNAAQGPKDVRLLAKLNGLTVSGPTTNIPISSMSLSGTTVTVNFALPAGITDFTPTTNIEGFTFYDQNTIPVVDSGPTGAQINFTSFVRVSATQAQGTLASTPTTGGMIRYADGVLYLPSGSPVDPTLLVAGNDAFLMPLQAIEATLPYTAPTTARVHTSVFSTPFS